MLPPFRALFVGATSGALGLSAYSLIGEPPPLALSLAAFTAYGTLVTSGVLLLPMRVFVDAVVKGPPGSKGVALTFDDGPDPKTTPLILDALDEKGAKATFFAIARKAEEHPALVRDIIARGHTVALHSYAHDRLFSLRRTKTVRADLERGLRTLEDVTGERTRWFRPPIGHTNPVIAHVCEELDLQVIGWSVSARDGTKLAREDACLTRVENGLRNGAIVLMHDASERGTHEPLGPKLVPKVLDAIAKRELAVAPLTSWRI